MPRSDAMSSTATRLVSVRSTRNGCVTFECVATADTARVMAREYGDAMLTRSRALPMRDAAISSCARNIFLSDWVDLMRCL